MTKVFIQSLADYNSGRIVGKWIDVSSMKEKDELFDAVQEVLALSHEPNAEEYEIADYDGFYGLKPCFSRLLQVAQALGEHGEAYAAYASHIGEDYATLALCDFCNLPLYSFA